MEIFPIFLSCLTAVLLVGSFPPLNFYPLAWIAFVPLFFSVSRERKPFSLILFFFSGFLVFLFLLHWLSVFGWYAWVSGAGYEALFTLLWGCFALKYLTGREGSFQELLFPPAAYAAMEVIRNLGPMGMPWGDLAYTQWKFLPVVEWSGLLGAISLSFLIMLANVLFFHALKYRRWKLLSAALLCFLIPAVYGLARLRAPEHFGRRLKVALIQTNDPQTLKWSRADYEMMLSEMDVMIKQASKQRFDLIFFPETALAGFLDRNPELESLVSSWAVRTKCWMAVGALKSTGNMPQNTVFLVDPSGKWDQSYEKVRLVPFGEYLPLFFRPLRGHWHALDPIVDFKPGKDFTVFHFPKGNFGVMICFESSFGWISREFVENGAGFLAVSTNDAWFEGTNAQEEHAAMAVFRAAETGRSFVQAGNTGISCILDPLGRILAWQRPETRAVVAGEVPISTSLTLYDLIGGGLPWLWILLPILLKGYELIAEK